jgi:lysozyme family protein
MQNIYERSKTDADQNTNCSNLSTNNVGKSLAPKPNAGNLTLNSSEQDKVQSNFDKYQFKVFGHEGGFVNDPKDPGGATNKGITLNTFKQFAKSDLGLEPTLENLKGLTNDQAAIIYKKHFWNKVKGDDIKNGSLAYAIYDFHVNAGNNAVKVLQETMNEMGENLKVDGGLGKNTLDAINRLPSDELFQKLQKNRKIYYQHLIQRNSKLKKFQKGWSNRVDSIQYQND